jgi:two-component system, LytTR family, response regulator
MKILIPDNMIRTLIVEDEKLSGITLQNYLLDFCKDDIEIIGITPTVAEAVTIIRKEKPDLVFLDVLLADGSGFDILRQIKNPGFRVIFTTGYDHFALDALRFHAAHYLLKPISVDALIESVEMVQKEINEESDYRNIKALLHKTMERDEKFEELYIRHHKGFDVLKINEITHCQADGGCTFVFLSTGKKTISTKPLGHFEDLLNNRNFIRVHHSYLVHRKYITGFQNEGVITLSGNISVPLGDAYRKKFMQHFQNG